jgi:DNA uptake protein ComE-like DNA-binding protein
VALGDDGAASEKVDLNTAKQRELEELSGVGAATARKIIAAQLTSPYRT